MALMTFASACGGSDEYRSACERVWTTGLISEADPTVDRNDFLDECVSGFGELSGTERAMVLAMTEDPDDLIEFIEMVEGLSEAFEGLDPEQSEQTATVATTTRVPTTTVATTTAVATTTRVPTTTVATTTAQSNTIEQGFGSKDASADILSIDCCKADILGFVYPAVTVKNNSSKPSDYWITVVAESEDGSHRYDDSFVMINSLNPGQTTTEEGLPFTGADDYPPGTVCRVSEVSRTASYPSAATATPTVATEVELSVDGSLLDVVQARGTLNCGVSGSAVAFSETQADGSVTGIDADFCRAVAAAVLGDAGAVYFVALSASERFTAVQTGDVDVLMRNTTWTQSRDSSVGMDFGPTTYYDGQQVMARVSDGFSQFSQVADIDGSVVCTNVGTTTEKYIAEAALLAGADIRLLGFESFKEVYETFIAGGCDVISTDGSALVGLKAKLMPADQEWVIFPATPITREPTGPIYRQDDSAWADAVNWTVYAMIIMDEYGITSANVDAVCAEGKIVGLHFEVANLCGVPESYGPGIQTAMGLAADAFYQVIKQVGSYGEVYDRNLNPVGLYREGSLNASWRDGGLIYPPPAR